MKRAIEDAMIALKTINGETPSIHIIVVVVSPSTLQAPPALAAATIATSDALIARTPEEAAAAVRAIVKTQAALKANVARAADQGCGNIIKKRREQPNQREHEEAALPIVRHESG